MKTRMRLFPDSATYTSPFGATASPPGHIFPTGHSRSPLMLQDSWRPIELNQCPKMDIQESDKTSIQFWKTEAYRANSMSIFQKRVESLYKINRASVAVSRFHGFTTSFNGLRQGELY